MGKIAEFKPKPSPDEYWVCACVKRDRQKRLTHIKGNLRSVLKCRRCGCTRDGHDALDRQLRPPR